MKVRPILGVRATLGVRFPIRRTAFDFPREPNPTAIIGGAVRPARYAPLCFECRHFFEALEQTGADPVAERASRNRIKRARGTFEDTSKGCLFAALPTERTDGTKEILGFRLDTAIKKANEDGHDSASRQ